MIAVTVHDILLRVPKGIDLQWPQDAAKVGRMAAVMLKEHAGERTMAVWVGLSEAHAIVQPLVALTPPRPMTHDLIARLVEVNGSHVERVAVTTLHNAIFYATLWVRVGNRVHEVDARPSDAFSLALRVQAPIFVGPEVFEQQGQPLERLLQAIGKSSQEIDSLGDTDIELRSFRSLLCRDGKARHPSALEK